MVRVAVPKVPALVYETPPLVVVQPPPGLVVLVSLRTNQLVSKLAVPSTSPLVKVMAALEVPAIALAIPPASIKVAVAALATNVGASLVPLIVNVKTLGVPSTE